MRILAISAAFLLCQTVYVRAEAVPPGQNEVPEQNLDQVRRTPRNFLRWISPFKKKKTAEEESGLAEFKPPPEPKRSYYQRFKEWWGFLPKKKEKRPPGENIFTDIARNVVGDAAPFINASVTTAPTPPGKRPMRPFYPWEHKKVIDLHEAELPFFRPESLKATGFKVVWAQRSLGEMHLRNLWLENGLILLETSENELYALSQSSGHVEWVYVFDDELDFKPTIDEEAMYAISNGILYYISQPAAKTYDWRRPLTFVPVTTPLFHDDMLFIGGLRHGFYAYHTRRKSITWRVPAPGRINSQPVLYEKHLYYSAVGGVLYNLEVRNHKFTWKYTKPLGEFASSVTIDSKSDPPRLYVGSQDHFLLGLNLSFGFVERVGEARRWELLLGGPISQRPVLHGEKMLFAVADYDGLYAIDRTTVTEKWYTPGIARIISQSAGELYCLTKDRELASVDMETGKIRWRFDFTPFEFVPQTLDSLTIVASTNSGQVYVLQAPTAGTPMEDIKMLKPAKPVAKKKAPAPKPMKVAPAPAKVAPAPAKVAPAPAKTAPAATGAGAAAPTELPE